MGKHLASKLATMALGAVLAPTAALAATNPEFWLACPGEYHANNRYYLVKIIE